MLENALNAAHKNINFSVHKPDLICLGGPYRGVQTGPSNFQGNDDCRYDIENFVLLANGIGNN